jgi:acetoin utilization deacetylase AcuC-like enzyme
MRRTGVFFHYQEGERLRDFPQALEGLLEKENVFFYDAFYPNANPTPFDLESIPMEVLYQVHTEEMVERVMASGVFDGALFSAAGTVGAATRIWRREIDNAFVFTGYGDHHAGRDSFGGGCYLNGAAMAILQLRQHFGVRRVAIVDTDAHHGNGTWEIFEDDPDTLYTCFCSEDYPETNNKVNIRAPRTVTDEEYLSLVRESFLPRAEALQPEIIFWNWGYDGTQGDYDDIGLTPQSHVSLARELKEAADRLCQGRLVVVLCGGRRRDVARSIIPQIISVLAAN